MSRLLQLIFAGLLLCGSTTFLQAQTSDADKEQLLRKLQEIEERLKKLEAEPTKEEEQPPQPQTVEVEELRRQVDVLAEEIEKIRSGEPEIEVSPQRARDLGLGPAAATVYRKPRGVSLAGYGEMVYENFDDELESGVGVNKTSQLDFLRAIIYAGYRFNDRFLFNSEIEFEHASTGQEGSASVEFAYIDFLANDHLTLRGGLLLVPMGLINEFHEPTVFQGALRPATERRIIPTTWRENGAGVLLSFDKVSARAYVVNGLRAKGFSSDGLRGGRQKGSKARADNLAFVGRLDVNPTPGLLLGGSLYRGGSGQGEFFRNGRELDVMTTIGELHGQFQFRGWDIRGLFARAAVDDARDLSLLLGRSLDDPVAETLLGGYVQLGYNVLAPHHETMALSPYYRFETLDTQNEVPQGFFRNPARDRHFHTLGLEFKPIFNIVIKGDYQWSRNDADTGLNQFNLGLGYAF